MKQGRMALYRSVEGWTVPQYGDGAPESALK